MYPPTAPMWRSPESSVPQRFIAAKMKKTKKTKIWEYRDCGLSRSGCASSLACGTCYRRGSAA